MSTVDYKTLEVGDVFWECAMGKNIKSKVLTSPQKHIQGDLVQWKFKAITVDDSKSAVSGGREMDYLFTEGMEHYCPGIYKEPMYYVK